ncbi:hypothetical protein C1I95_22440 [Micromonospora craterilacus]|uniref:Uncharacterized protein n=1 Tax=Micromonospora craterilacus TaxID=1655439 RepID=A0A2W2ENU3_9ACTN|nr:hypothetical protein [Micromonospora craterilacus]PZG14078.1 hypothetical protein C1I95_22440 [Micromonospora craterilacus]
MPTLVGSDLAEMPGTIALQTLRQLVHDDDRPVALTASTLVNVLEERGDDPDDARARRDAGTGPGT